MPLPVDFQASKLKAVAAVVRMVFQKEVLVRGEKKNVLS